VELEGRKPSDEEPKEARRITVNRAPLIKQDLRALRDKYERMLSLRTAHARARDDAGFVEADPRPEMARLAAEFPGALREIDMLPLEVIAARIRAIRSAERSPDRAERWMFAQVVFHQHARGALAVKRWLAGRKTITPAIRSAFSRWAHSLGARDDVLLFVDALDAIANPPRGRIMNVVHDRVAVVLDVSTTEVRALVFGFEQPDRA
jgi:hypothetical protein